MKKKIAAALAGVMVLGTISFTPSTNLMASIPVGGVYTPTVVTSATDGGALVTMAGGTLTTTTALTNSLAATNTLAPTESTLVFQLDKSWAGRHVGINRVGYTITLDNAADAWKPWDAGTHATFGGDGSWSSSRNAHNVATMGNMWQGYAPAMFDRASPRPVVVQGTSVSNVFAQVRQGVMTNIVGTLADGFTGAIVPDANLDAATLAALGGSNNPPTTLADQLHYRALGDGIDINTTNNTNGGGYFDFVKAAYQQYRGTWPTSGQSAIPYSLRYVNGNTIEVWFEIGDFATANEVYVAAVPLVFVAWRNTAVSIQEMIEYTTTGTYFTGEDYTSSVQIFRQAASPSVTVTFNQGSGEWNIPVEFEVKEDLRGALNPNRVYDYTIVAPRGYTFVNRPYSTGGQDSNATYRIGWGSVQPTYLGNANGNGLVNRRSGWLLEDVYDTDFGHFMTNGTYTAAIDGTIPAGPNGVSDWLDAFQIGAYVPTTPIVPSSANNTSSAGVFERGLNNQQIIYLDGLATGVIHVRFRGLDSRQGTGSISVTGLMITPSASYEAPYYQEGIDWTVGHVIWKDTTNRLGADLTVVGNPQTGWTYGARGAGNWRVNLFTGNELWTSNVDRGDFNGSGYGVWYNLLMNDDDEGGSGAGFARGFNYNTGGEYKRHGDTVTNGLLGDNTPTILAGVRDQIAGSIVWSEMSHEIGMFMNNGLYFELVGKADTTKDIGTANEKHLTGLAKIIQVRLYDRADTGSLKIGNSILGNGTTAGNGQVANVNPRLAAGYGNGVIDLTSDVSSVQFATSVAFGTDLATEADGLVIKPYNVDARQGNLASLVTRFTLSVDPNFIKLNGGDDEIWVKTWSGPNGAGSAKYYQIATVANPVDGWIENVTSLVGYETLNIGKVVLSEVDPGDFGDVTGSVADNTIQLGISEGKVETSGLNLNANLSNRVYFGAVRPFTANQNWVKVFGYQSDEWKLNTTSKIYTTFQISGINLGQEGDPFGGTRQGNVINMVIGRTSNRPNPTDVSAYNNPARIELTDVEVVTSLTKADVNSYNVLFRVGNHNQGPTYVMDRSARYVTAAYPSWGYILPNRDDTSGIINRPAQNLNTVEFRYLKGETDFTEFFINGSDIPTTVPAGTKAFIDSKTNRTMVSVRLIASLFGIDEDKLGWSGSPVTDVTVDATKEIDKVIKFHIGSDAAVVNTSGKGDVIVNLSDGAGSFAPEIVDGFTYLPLRGIALTFGVEIHYVGYDENGDVCGVDTTVDHEKAVEYGIIFNGSVK